MLTAGVAATLSAPIRCQHCGNSVPHWRTGTFCCQGCESVYQLLRSSGLTEYYNIRSELASEAKTCPARPSQQDFHYLDQEDFLATLRDRNRLRFFLEGAHCVACVWLVEKLPELCRGVVTAQLDLGHAVASIEKTPDASWNEIARTLDLIGYRPHPMTSDSREDLVRQENHRFLKRVGVAAFSAGNIMLLAISVYGGAHGQLGMLFGWISFALFLPCLLYSAVPFFKNSWGALRAKTLSIDIPVAFGLMVSTGVSLVNLLRGSDEVYFDSSSALVFLLMGSRYLLSRAQQKAFETTRILHFLTPATARRWNEERREYDPVRTENLVANDRVEVRVGEAIPADGLVTKGKSLINTALITGEAQAQAVTPGHNVFAGTINLQAPIEIQVLRAGASSRVGQIVSEIESAQGKKPAWLSFTDRTSRYFVAAVLTLSFVTFFSEAPHNIHTALDRLLAVVIIACPCIFALATPLVLTLALARGAKQGLLIKGADVLERVRHSKQIALDKTGTLTTGTFEVLSSFQDVAIENFAGIIVALESHSAHPIAQALLSYFGDRLPSRQNIPTVNDFRETLGIGVSGRIDGHHYSLRSLDERTEMTGPQSATRIGLYRDERLVGHIVLGSQLRPDSQDAVRELERLHCSPSILSGDHIEAVQTIAHDVGIPALRAHARMSPEDKAAWVLKNPGTIMVGDGANDALALQKAHVGVAVHGGMDVSLKAADVYVTQPGLKPLVELVQISREVDRIIKRNLIYSFFYNIVGAWLAMTGQITPLAAAVLMPVSALIVLVSSLMWRNPNWRKS